MRYLILIVVLAVAAPAAAQSPEAEFQRGLRLERTQGDYAGAISIYESLATGDTERPLRGRAMIQLARAYENLGRAEAARTYQRVLADFSDMDELVAEARAGYARTREEVGSPAVPRSRGARTALNEEGLNGWGASLSPSGRLMASVEHKPFGIQIIDVATNTRRFIPVDHGAGEIWSEYVRFSPDESEVAIVVSYPSGDIDAHVLRIGLESGEARLVVSLGDYYREVRGESDWCGRPQVHDWSSDGEYLLVFSPYHPESCGFADSEEDLLLVPVNGGDVRFAGSIDDPEYSLWEQSCLTADGGAVFTDVTKTDDNGKWSIRRIDTDSGESSIWRKDANIWSCPWDDETLLYGRKDLRGLSIFAGDPNASDARSDTFVTSFGANAWPLSGSKTGDLAAWLDGGQGRLFFVGAVDETMSIQSGDLVALVKDKHVWAFGWSPDGAELAYAPFNEQRITIRGAADQSVRHIDLPEKRFGVLRWVDRQHFTVRAIGEERARTLLVDAQTGEISPVNFEEARGHGLRGWVTPLSRDVWIGWREGDDGCLLRFSPDTWEKTPAYCLDSDAYARASGVRPSPYGDLILNWGHSKGADPSISVTSKDTWEVQALPLPDGMGEFAIGATQWLSAEEVALFGRASGGNAQRTSVWSLNVVTGESRPVLQGLLEQFDALGIAIRPGHAEVAAFGRPNVESSFITVVHNVLGRD